jgi:integrase
MYSGNRNGKKDRPLFTSTRLLDQLRERLRYLHYSLQTEKNYVYWVRWFIRWHGVRHPKDMGGKEVEAFLSMLANERKVAPSTHRQALSALLFLYKEVLDLELPWMQEIGRPLPTKRIPVVLTAAEIKQTLVLMEGVTGLLARLLYGTGMRLREGLSLRVKDVDFERNVIVVREGKGGKDRVVMLPAVLKPALKVQLAYARAVWDADRQA